MNNGMLDDLCRDWSQDLLLGGAAPGPVSGPDPGDDGGVDGDGDGDGDDDGNPLELYDEIERLTERKDELLKEAERDTRAFINAYVPPLFPRHKLPGRLKPVHGASEEMKRYKRQWYLTNRRRVIMKSAICRHLAGAHDKKAPEDRGEDGGRMKKRKCPLCDEIRALDAQLEARRSELDRLVEKAGKVDALL